MLSLNQASDIADAALGKAAVELELRPMTVSVLDPVPWTGS